MHRDHQRWYFRTVSVGTWASHLRQFGWPILAFPTGHGRRVGAGRSEYDSHSQPYGSTRGESESFCINGVQSDRFANKERTLSSELDAGAVPDAYVGERSFSVHRFPVPNGGHRIATLGASLGAYHAANTLFKIPTT